MAQIVTKFIKDNNVTAAKIQLGNSNWLRGRNAANSADINILEVDSSNTIQFGLVPQTPSAPVNNNDVANKAYVDLAAANMSDKNITEFFSLSPTQISNGYIDLSYQAFDLSLSLEAGGVGQVLGSDYTLSLPTSVTRVTFLSPLTSILAAGDEIQVTYTQATSLGTQQLSGKYTLSGLSGLTQVTGSDPTQIGQYRALYRSSNALVDAVGITAPSLANGFFMYANVNSTTATGTASQPTVYRIFVGKNKASQQYFWSAAGRSGNVNVDFLVSGTNTYGLHQKYDPFAGILEINGDDAIGSGRYADYAGNQSLYFDAIVSDNPVFIGTVGNYTSQIIPLATDQVPYGTLECDGSAVSKLSYARLFSVVGTRWGAGTFTSSLAYLTTIADVATPATASVSGVTLTANTSGLIGNSISLVFDGATPVSTVVANWNAANPSNQLTASADATPSAQTVNLSGGTDNLDGKYFNIYDDSGLVVVWIQIASTTVQPSVMGASRYIPVTTILPNDTDVTVAADIAAALNADAQFAGTTSASDIVTILNSSTAEHQAGSSGNSGFTYSQVNTGGSQTFNLPDLRGEFLRGWDHGAGNDPDAASRSATNGGASGDNVGSAEGDTFQAHDHYIPVYGNPGNSARVCGGTTPFIGYTSTAGVLSGNPGSETRPKNKDVMYVIVY